MRWSTDIAEWAEVQEWIYVRSGELPMEEHPRTALEIERSRSAAGLELAELESVVGQMYDEVERLQGKVRPRDLRHDPRVVALERTRARIAVLRTSLRSRSR